MAVKGTGMAVALPLVDVASVADIFLAAYLGQGHLPLKTVPPVRGTP